MLGNDPLERPLQPKYIDQMPRIRRKSVEIPALNDFIFSNSYRLETNIIKAKQFINIPFVMTGVQATRQYVMSQLIHEDLLDYAELINDILENEKESEFAINDDPKQQNSERWYVSEDYLKENNIDEDLMNDLNLLPYPFKKNVGYF